MLREGAVASTLRLLWMLCRGRYPVEFMGNLIVINFNYDLRPELSQIIQQLPQKSPYLLPSPPMGELKQDIGQLAFSRPNSKKSSLLFKFKIKSTILIIYA